jgi:hypothetical protein
MTGYEFNDTLLYAATLALAVIVGVLIGVSIAIAFVQFDR